MLGTSRESLTALQQFAADRNTGADAASELLQAAAAIAADRTLRVSVTDTGLAADSRAAIVRELFGGRISAAANDLLVRAVELRWAHADDLIEALEHLAAGLLFKAANTAGELDRMEDEIFHFGRAVEANAELQMALTNPALSAEVKASIVQDVLAGRALAGSQILLSHLAGQLRGRRVDVAVDALSQLAADERQRAVAQVRVAVALTEDQTRRLAAALGRLAGRPVSLNVVIDSNVIGGVSVRLGDEIIDGGVRTRLDQARRALIG